MHAAFLDKNTSTCWMVVLVLLDLNVESGEWRLPRNGRYERIKVVDCGCCWLVVHLTRQKRIKCDRELYACRAKRDEDDD